jgi:hypothetical protein
MCQIVGSEIGGMGGDLSAPPRLRVNQYIQ